MASTMRTSAESAVERPVPPSMVERMTLILDLFEHPHTHRTLEDVTRRTRLPRSTAHRILDQLVRLRWLEHTNAGYRLGGRALGLGGREPAQNALRSAAAPVLHDLAIRTDLVVHLAVLTGTDVYYLDKDGGRSAVEVPSRVGGRAPAHCTALGKARTTTAPASMPPVAMLLRRGPLPSPLPSPLPTLPASCGSCFCTSLSLASRADNRKAQMNLG